MKGSGRVNGKKIAKKSELQFTNPILSSFCFKANREYEDNGNIHVEYSIEKQRNGERSALLKLKVVIGDDQGKAPFNISATIEAVFMWTDKLDDKVADELLNRNGVVLLLSYLRPLIAHMTVDAGYPPLNLPFFDVSND